MVPTSELALNESTLCKANRGMHGLGDGDGGGGGDITAHTKPVTWHSLTYARQWHCLAQSIMWVWATTQRGSYPSQRMRQATT